MKQVLESEPEMGSPIECIFFGPFHKTKTDCFDSVYHKSYDENHKEKNT